MEKPYIEIVGTSEVEVAPNQIFISVVLSEDIQRRQSIEEQEDALIRSLKSAGIDTEKLVVVDTTAHYGKSGWLSKDVMQTKQFELEVSSASLAAQVFETLADLKIKDAHIVCTDHSELEQIKKDARIQAIKNAKEKATYMLEAIVEKLGAPSMINEQNHGIRTQTYRAKAHMALASNRESVPESVEEFKKIEILAQIYTRWYIA